MLTLGLHEASGFSRIPSVYGTLQLWQSDSDLPTGQLGSAGQCSPFFVAVGPIFDSKHDGAPTCENRSPERSVLAPFVAMPFAPSSLLLLVVHPGAPK